MQLGGGKTFIAAGIIAKFSVSPCIFYVTSKDLLKQAKDELERFILQDGKNIQVGQIGCGKLDIKDVNIMTVQTAIRSLGQKFKKLDDEDEEDNSISKDKYEEIKKLITSAKIIMLDECQHTSSETCQVISDYSENAKYKFGLSATPHRDLDDDILIDACFGKTIIDINASFLIKKGILVPPTIYFIHTKKQLDGAYQDVYSEGIVNNDERNKIIANVAQNMEKQGRKILILVKIIEHGEILEKLIPNSVFVNGSNSTKFRQEHLDLMRKNECNVTIASSIYDEGVDIKALDGLILARIG